MRRFTRPIVVATLALGLAVGSGVGLAGPADADTGSPFSITIDSGPSSLEFGGDKYTDSTIIDVSTDDPPNEGNEAVDLTTATNDSGSAVCTGLGSGSGTWSCDYQGDVYGGRGYQLRVIEQDADGSLHDHLLNYDNGDGISSEYPVRSYSFTPSGVTLSATFSPRDADTEIDGYEQNGPEGWSALPECDSYPCTVSLAPWINDNGAPAYETLYRFLGDANLTQDYFVVYRAPVVASVTDAGNDTATVTGTSYFGNAGLPLTVYDEQGTAVCTTTASAGDAGDWSCTTSSLGAGTHQLDAAVEDLGDGFGFSANSDFTEPDSSGYAEGAYSNLSNALPITFAAATGPTNPANPTGPTGGIAVTGDVTPNWTFSVSGNLTNLHPGDTITVTGSGLPAGTALDTVLHSTPTDLGSFVAGPDGSFTQTDVIPAGVDLGAHTIQVTASGPGLVSTTKQQAITVTSPPATSSGSSTKTVTAPAPTATEGGGGRATGTRLAPNILSRALTPIADVAVHPNKIISAFEIGLVLLLLAVLPAHLLNATISEQSDRFERRFRGVHAPNWMYRLGLWFRSAPVVGGIIVTLATAILFGFADPKFGFTLASLRLVLACGIALFLVGYVANALTGLIARTRWNIVAAVSTRPYGLILTVVGVLVSRLLHFSPGFLIGLILGLTIQGRSAAGYAWRTVVLRSSIVLVMAIAAWIGYSTLTLGGNEGGTFGSALLVETLVAITTEGVVALLVELLPLRFLEGERIYAHSRVLWGLFYVITLVVFVLAVIPWEGNWDALGASLWVWILVLAVFAAICVGVYIYFRRFAPPLEEDAGSESISLAETVAGDRS